VSDDESCAVSEVPYQRELCHTSDGAVPNITTTFASSEEKRYNLARFALSFMVVKMNQGQQGSVKDSKRRLHAYCVGQAKSGTASLWGACRTQFKAAHEPERSEVLAKALQIADGSISDDEVVDWLKKRDERLQLDVDISWCNYFLLDHLVDTFPSASYIVLIRDCYTWMESVIGHMLTREIPSDAREFMEFWFRTAEHPHGEGEEQLHEAGLFSLAAYLTTWRDHIVKCEARIPVDCRLIVRTHEFTAGLPAIAAFLGVAAEELDCDQCQLNQGTWEGRIADYVDTDLVESVVNRTCRHTMSQHFPEVGGLEDAYRLWSERR